MAFRLKMTHRHRPGRPGRAVRPGRPRQEKESGKKMPTDRELITDAGAKLRDAFSRVVPEQMQQAWGSDPLEVICAVANWADSLGESLSGYELLLEIAGGVRKLAHAHLKSEHGVCAGEDHDANARDAIGDIIVCLTYYCGHRGWTATECARNAFAKVGERDQEDGHGYRAEEIHDTTGNIAGADSSSG